MAAEIRSLANAESDDRRVELSVSTEAPAERWFGSETLIHTGDAVDLSFFASGRAPLLADHDTTRQIGVVESAWLDADGKLRAVVRFSRSAAADEIYRDVLDGIRGNTSVGYRYLEWEAEPDGSGFRFTRWKPHEVSIVSVPADETVGVGRSISKKGHDMPEDNTTPAEPRQAVDTAAIEARALADGQARGEAIADCYQIAAKHNLRADLDAWLTPERRAMPADRLAAEWRGVVLGKLDGRPIVTNEIGMSTKETRRFSMMKLVRYMDDPKRSHRDAAAFELEACAAADDVTRNNGGAAAVGNRLPDEILLNWDMSKRTLNTTDDAALVPTEHLAGSFIDVLRNKASIMRAGGTILNGLTGNIDIPKQVTESTAAWISAEHGDAAATEATFGTVSLTPKDVAAYTDMTRRMMQQSAPGIEALVRADIVFAMAKALDIAAIEGPATGGAPRGVRNVVGINKPTGFVAAVPTWAEVIAMETALADDEALDGNLSYIGRTNLRGALKSTPKVAGHPTFIMDGDGKSLNGYPFIDSNRITDGNLYFGNWSQVLLGFWSGLDLRVSDEALLLKGGRRIVAFQTMDVAVRHPESFCWNRIA